MLMETLSLDIPLSFLRLLSANFGLKENVTLEKNADTLMVKRNLEPRKKNTFSD
jgi:hypothetical protein